MQTLNDRTPVLIGVGQAAERPQDADYRALSPVALAAEAARRALEDAGATGDLAAAIDTIAAIRQFEISTPAAKPPFGASNNFPRSVGARVGAAPRRAVLEITGGQGPQRLVGEFCAAIAAGEAEAVMLVGSEAMSTVLHLQAKGETPDWSETVEGDLEDRGYGLEGMFTPSLLRHRIRGAIPAYALFENARRGRLGQDRATYARAMGELFAPFTEVAARNPYAAAPVVRSAAELIEVNERNRIVADPFTRMLVARDQVNQAACVILTSVGKAKALGVPQDRWVYLHGEGDANELTIMERPDISASPQSIAAGKLALDLAGKGVADMALFDFYSCFPIAVFNMLDGLGMAPDDPRGLTLTGGLPYFGGAGNNYSMHAIAEMVAALRARPGAYGFVGANGGMLSKYGAGVYSTEPADWSRPQARRGKVPEAHVPGLELDAAEGPAKLETFTIVPHRDGDVVVAIGRLDGSGRRFAANQAEGDTATLDAARSRDPLGRSLTVRTDDQGLNRFVFAD
ncbi:MAG TPA: acetyl-CoA acetyltransferase [Phenylobacterium sp.]|nr:acetyl-CoA acetyltransferase [Phenylobacterium sp.]